MKIIEKEYKILEIDKKNKNHRCYTKALVSIWVEDSLNFTEENSGFDLEYAIDEEEDERDIYREYVSSSLSCGVVNNLKIKKGSLYANVKFKLPDSCYDLTKKIYNKELELDSLAIVPKGKGSVKNQTVQDDYELYGFNLILLEDSAFAEDEKKKEVAK
jgi:hypothetical protein